MPELAEVKIMSEYINYVSNDEEYISVEKSEKNKNPNLEIPYKSFRISSTSRGKELMLVVTDTETEEEKKFLRKVSFRTRLARSRLVRSLVALRRIGVAMKNLAILAIIIAVAGTVASIGLTVLLVPAITLCM